jgi:phosphoglycolate phosphatase
MARRYRHIIWDWNGTLLDDTWLCVEVINHLLSVRNLATINEQDYRQHFGFPVIHYYNKLGFDFGEKSFEEVSVEFIGLYHQRRLECRLHPAADEVLGTTRRLGLSQSVLSAYQQDMLDSIIDHYGLRPYFSHLVGLSDIFAHGKIDRGREHLKQLQLSPDGVLLVGDTVHDFEVAHALGVDCVLLEHGHHPREKLAACGTRLGASLRDVLTLLED